MYHNLMLEDKVRVPPQRLGERIEKVILDVLQEQLEGSIDKEIGIFICVTRVMDVGEGELVPGDGGVYYDVKFEAMIDHGIHCPGTSCSCYPGIWPLTRLLENNLVS